jgi:hypothetical protein
MTAEIIDFKKKAAEKKIRKWLETDITKLSPEELQKFTSQLREHIIKNADAVSPSSLPGHTSVMINGMAYIISDPKID